MKASLNFWNLRFITSNASKTRFASLSRFWFAYLLYNSFDLTVGEARYATGLVWIDAQTTNERRSRPRCKKSSDGMPESSKRPLGQYAT